MYLGREVGFGPRLCSQTVFIPPLKTGTLPSLVHKQQFINTKGSQEVWKNFAIQKRLGSYTRYSTKQ